MMSAKAIDVFGERIHSLLADVPHKLVPRRACLPGRKLTADSGKVRLAPSLTEYYDAMRASPGMKWFYGHAAGADRPIFDEMLSKGVMVTRLSGANAKPVAQMAFLGALALARQLPILIESQRHQHGSRSWVSSPWCQTAVVVGLGPIGLEVARLLKAVDVRVLGAAVSESRGWGRPDRCL